MKAPKMTIIYTEKWSEKIIQLSFLMLIWVRSRGYILLTFSPVVSTILTNILNMDKEIKP